MDLSEREIGWLSGIIDGEGNFTVRILKGKTKTLGIRVRFQPQLVIVNTKKSIIDRVEEIYKKIGILYRIYERDRTKTNKNAKMQWHVITYTKGLKQLFPSIEEIVDKRDEIEIIKKFMAEKKRGNTTPYTTEELQQRERWRKELIELHGNQAKKLATNMADEFTKTSEELEIYKKDLGKKIGEGHKKGKR